MSCKHRKTWIAGAGFIEWCFECGAIRRLKRMEGNKCAPSSRWACPVGKGGANPYEIWEKPLRNRTARKTG